MNTEVARRAGTQLQPPKIVAFAVVVIFDCLVVAAMRFLRRMPANDRDPPAVTTGDECELSECGADGVPLSLYAG